MDRYVQDLDKPADVASFCSAPPKTQVVHPKIITANACHRSVLQPFEPASSLGDRAVRAVATDSV